MLPAVCAGSIFCYKAYLDDELYGGFKDLVLLNFEKSGGDT